MIIVKRIYYEMGFFKGFLEYFYRNFVPQMVVDMWIGYKRRLSRNGSLQDYASSWRQ